MEQINIYDVLGTDRDPMFERVVRLKKGQYVEFGDVKVFLNQQGLYEIESDKYHECFSSINALYDGLSKLISDLANPVF